MAAIKQGQKKPHQKRCGFRELRGRNESQKRYEPTTFTSATLGALEAQLKAIDAQNQP